MGADAVQARWKQVAWYLVLSALSLVVLFPVYMTLDVPDLKTLSWVLAKIEQIPNVMEARRRV